MVSAVRFSFICPHFEISGISPPQYNGDEWNAVCGAKSAATSFSRIFKGPLLTKTQPRTRAGPVGSGCFAMGLCEYLSNTRVNPIGITVSSDNMVSHNHTFERDSECTVSKKNVLLLFLVSGVLSVFESVWFKLGIRTVTHDLKL